MKKTILVCLVLLCVSGCGAVKDAIDETVNDIASKFAGNYTGTFSSTSGTTDKGTFDFVVDSKGKATGSVKSTTFGKEYPITGNVNASGDLAAAAADSKYKFNGNVNPSGVYTGSWESPTSKGSFNGERNGGSTGSTDSATSTSAKLTGTLKGTWSTYCYGDNSGPITIVFDGSGTHATTICVSDCETVKSPDKPLTSDGKIYVDEVIGVQHVTGTMTKNGSTVTGSGTFVEQNFAGNSSCSNTGKWSVSGTLN